MKLKINGKEVDLEGSLTLDNLLSLYRLRKDQVVVELNRIVPDKGSYTEVFLKDGDEIEILKFLGGG